MSQRHPYTYQFASSSSHGILKDGPQQPSERTPLIHQSEYESSEGSQASSNGLNREQDRPHSPSDSPSFLEQDLSPLSTSGFASSESREKHAGPAVALTLENSGSVARDHLASERTFLAYVRTSLSIASAGVALAQILSFTEYFTEADTESLRRVEGYARPLGASAVLLALFVLGIGEHALHLFPVLKIPAFLKLSGPCFSLGIARYFSIQTALVKGRFPVARGGVALIAALLGALVVATFGVLLHGRLQKA
ncbi:hypothetical protein H0H81_003121 [Sphagnurus paluster]|uniref:DUF202 domain-containing protein n=1 Tax=Sphagnurus paluster TaxID=117069 RepID=A0A9P7FNC0_9AGAR|nr:hypothetical protein H0H81_003121 [Sphagnurus paluster]